MTPPAPPAAGAVPSRLRRRLAAFHPAALLAVIPGPIFTKETQLLGRKASTYWTRGIYSFLLLALISIVFLGMLLERSSSSNAARLQQYQTIAPAVTITILWFQFILLTICAAAFCSGAICEERRKGTLSALLTTPLTAWQIILGKILGGSVQLLVLVLFPTPLLLALRVFGGVEASTILGALGLTVANALLAATLATWHSIHVPRAASAMLAALLSFALIQFGPILVFVLQTYYGGAVSMWFAYYSTPVAMGGLTADMMAGAGARMPFSVWLAAKSSVYYTLAWTAFVFIAASWNLRWWMRREAAGASPASAAASTAPPQTAESPDAAPNSTKRKTTRRRVPHLPHASREVSDRPVLWRELRQTAFRSRRLLWTASIAISSLLMYLYYVAEVENLPLHLVLTAILSVICVCTAAVASTSAINGEQESRTLDSLLSTPLSAREIVLGKFLGAFRKLWFFPAVLFTHILLAVAFFQVLRPIAILHLALLLLPALAALCASGIWFSALFKKTTLAAALNFGLALGAWAVLPLGLGLMLEIFFAGRASETVMSVLLLFNPVPMSVIAAGGGFIERNNYPASYQLLEFGEVTPAVFTILSVGFAVLYFGLTYVFLTLAAARLATVSGRVR